MTRRSARHGLKVPRVKHCSRYRDSFGIRRTRAVHAQRRQIEIASHVTRGSHLIEQIARNQKLHVAYAFLSFSYRRANGFVEHQNFRAFEILFAEFYILFHPPEISFKRTFRFLVAHNRVSRHNVHRLIEKQSLLDFGGSHTGRKSQLSPLCITMPCISQPPQNKQVQNARNSRPHNAVYYYRTHNTEHFYARAEYESFGLKFH